jgi:hypothetical protein
VAQQRRDRQAAWEARQLTLGQKASFASGLRDKRVYDLTGLDEEDAVSVVSAVASSVNDIDEQSERQGVDYYQELEFEDDHDVTRVTYLTQEERYRSHILADFDEENMEFTDNSTEKWIYVDSRKGANRT